MWCRVRPTGDVSSTFATMKGNETDGLPEGPLPLGTPVTGRIYFDVRNGTNPGSVVLPGRRRHGQGRLERLATRLPRPEALLGHYAHMLPTLALVCSRV
jgi:Domain of unknown function (DUF1942)